MFAKLLIVLAFALAAAAGNDPKGSGNNPEGLVDWSADRRLSWNDFKGRPDPATGNAALTSTSINIDYSYNKHELKYSIRCQFDPTKSWGRVRNNHILGHEQAHFDIAEIHARLLHKMIKEYKFRPATVNEDIAKIYDRVMQQHHNMQAEYDGQTDFSRKPTIQEEWENRIAQSLEELEGYAGYRK
jgi:predicted secreted Zn-dependent protease